MEQSTEPAAGNLEVAWLARSPSLQSIVNCTRRRLEGVDGVLAALAGREEGLQASALSQLHAALSRAYLDGSSQFSYGEGFMAYLAESWGGRVAASSSQEEALATVLGALATIIAADPVSYGDTDSRLRTASSLAAATISLYWATSLRSDMLALPAADQLATALSSVLLGYSKLPAYGKKDDPEPGRPSFFDVLSQGVASAVFAAAHSVASLLLEYGSSTQRQQLVWKKLVPACLRVVRQFDGLNDEYLLDPANYAFAQHSFALLQMIAQQAERPTLSLEDSVQSLLEPADTVDTMEASISFFHSATIAHAHHLKGEESPSAEVKKKLAEVLVWQAGTLKLINLLLQHGCRLDAFLDDGGILAVCLFVSKYAKHHAMDPCTHPVFPALTLAVEILDWCMCSAASGKRARELFQDGDNVSSGCAVLCAALQAAPTQEQLLADLVVRRSLARWTFKRSLLRCLETAVSWNPTCRRQFVEKDGIGIAVRCARWRPEDPSWRPRQEAQLVRSNPSFVRGIAGNAQSLISVASQNLDDDTSWWNKTAEQFAAATTVDEVMGYLKWMPNGFDATQEALNADKLNCSWSLHTAIWRCLHHVTYQSKEQRTAFAENDDLLKAAAEALNLPVLGAEGSTKGKVCPYKPSILWALYNAVRLVTSCRPRLLALGVHERTLQLLAEAFSLAADADRRLIKSTANSKRKGGSSSTAATVEKTLLSVLAVQADAGSQLLEELLVHDDAETVKLCVSLLLDKRLLQDCQAALSKRIGSSYSNSKLQDAEQRFQRVMTHAEAAVEEQRQKEKRSAAKQAERTAALLLAEEEAAARRRAAKAAKRQRQRASQQQQQQRYSSEESESEQDVAPQRDEAEEARLKVEEEEAARQAAAAREAQQRQAYAQMLADFDRAEKEAAAAAEAARLERQRERQQRQKERRKEKEAAKKAAKAVQDGGQGPAPACVPASPAKPAPRPAMAQAAAPAAAARNASPEPPAAGTATALRPAAVPAAGANQQPAAAAAAAEARAVQQQPHQQQQQPLQQAPQPPPPPSRPPLSAPASPLIPGIKAASTPASPAAPVVVPHMVSAPPSPLGSLHLSLPIRLPVSASHSGPPSAASATPLVTSPAHGARSTAVAAAAHELSVQQLLGGLSLQQQAAAPQLQQHSHQQQLAAAAGLAEQPPVTPGLASAGVRRSVSVPAVPALLPVLASAPASSAPGSGRGMTPTDHQPAAADELPMHLAFSVAEAALGDGAEALGALDESAFLPSGLLSAFGEVEEQQQPVRLLRPGINGSASAFHDLLGHLLPANAATPKQARAASLPVSGSMAAAAAADPVSLLPHSLGFEVSSPMQAGSASTSSSVTSGGSANGQAVVLQGHHDQQQHRLAYLSPVSLSSSHSWPRAPAPL